MYLLLHCRTRRATEAQKARLPLLDSTETSRSVSHIIHTWHGIAWHGCGVLTAGTVTVTRIHIEPMLSYISYICFFVFLVLHIFVSNEISATVCSAVGSLSSTCSLCTPSVCSLQHPIHRSYSPHFAAVLSAACSRCDMY